MAAVAGDEKGTPPAGKPGEETVHASVTEDQLEEARREADVTAQIEKEHERLMEATTCFRLVFPKGNDDDDDDDEDDDDEGKGAKGGTAGKSGASSPKTTKKKKKKDEKKSMVPCCGSRGLFRFADSLDITLYVISFVSAVADGAVLPAFAVIFGDMVDALTQGGNELQTRMDNIALLFVYLGLITFVTSLFEVGFANIAATRQAAVVREEYMRSLLRQEMSFYDKEDPGEVATRLTEDTIEMENGIGEKLSTSVKHTATFVVGLGVGFYFGWDLALVIIAFVPVMAIPMAVLTQSKATMTKIAVDSYARAGSAATEAISNIRTVVAFGGQAAEARRYEKQLDVAALTTFRGGRVIGFAVGTFWLAIMGSYAAAFAFGASLIRNSREANPVCSYAFVAVGAAADCYTPGTLMKSFFAVIIGAMSVGQIVPGIGLLAKARASAFKIFSVIDRKSKIDPTAGRSGESSTAAASTSARARGHIEFRDVTFAYPSDKDKKVLIGFSFTLEPGQTLALVGESGSGKSTIVQLLMRFYDPDEGKILLDGKDLREYDVAWLRSQMGLVQQEPSLFSTSIEENIALGLPTYASNFGEVTLAAAGAAEASEDESAVIKKGTGSIWGVDIDNGQTADGLAAIPPAVSAAVREAAAAASVSEFATALPKGFRTRVGDRGGQLSGGQKQRVAIARALIRKPSIFIGDEATSALDSKSEKEVKRAIDKLLREAKDDASSSGKRGGLTSILIAHRLSTITNADRILVLATGRLIEDGNHESLMAKRGVYYNLAAGQGLGDTVESGADPASPDLKAIKADAAAVPPVGAAAASAKGKEGDGEDASESADDFSTIKARVDSARAKADADAVDALFFSLMDTAVSTDSASSTASPSDSAREEPLASDDPRVTLFVSSFLEMARSEKLWLLAWWLGETEERVTELVAMAVPDAVRELSPDAKEGKARPSPRLRKESAAMVRKAKDSKSPIWDAEPEADAKTRVLHIPPARTRNSLLKSLLLASRPNVGAARLWSYYTRADIPVLIMGLLSAIGDGATFPVYALVLSDMLTVLGKTGSEFDEGVLTFCLAFVGIGVGAMLATWGRVFFFEILGARLTTRTRLAAYEALLKQEVGFFDLPHNNVGQLAGRLGSDAALVRQTTGERVGLTLSALSSLGMGIGIAFSASWRLSLVMVAVVPLLILTGVVQMVSLNGFSTASKEALQKSAQIATEAMTGIRTVSGLGLETHVARNFARSLEGPRSLAVRAGLVGGASLGLAQLVLFCAAYGLVFWSGSRFIAEGFITFNEVSKVFFALTFASTGIGQATALAGDASKAEAAVKSIFALVHRTPKIPSGSGSAGASGKAGAAASAPSKVAVDGALASRSAHDKATASPGAAAGKAEPRGEYELVGVSFSYPARPDAIALRDVSTTIKAGTTVGLVGPSGSGKSTIVQLLMRFYDPDEGKILLDGKDLREYDPDEVRARIGLIQQEPVLFSDTVHYNVAYGQASEKPVPNLGLATESHPTVTAVRPAVVEAATAASADDFIRTRLPLGYTSFAGMQGSSRLSGGQKQRIAIARALIRKPAIILGDEATSALDTQSEAEVQKALDEMLAEAKAKHLDRTSVFVAHRLSTIKDADKIIVLEDGRIREEGSHDALVAEKGLYHRLAQAQSLAEGAAAEGDKDAAAAGAAAASAPDGAGL